MYVLLKEITIRLVQTDGLLSLQLSRFLIEWYMSRSVRKRNQPKVCKRQINPYVFENLILRRICGLHIDGD